MWLKQIAQQKLESRVTFALCNPDIFEQQTYINCLCKPKLIKSQQNDPKEVDHKASS